jgi:hypothetical protein
MAAGLGAESLAARFKAGDGLEGYFGRWLLLEAAGGDVEAEDNLATSRQIPLIRIVMGEKLNMEDIGTSWYPFKKKELQGKTKGSRQSTTVQLPTATRCMQVAVSMEKLPETCLAGSGANGLELRRSLWLEAGSVRQRRRAKTGPAAAPCTIITAALLSPRCMQVAVSMEKPPGTWFCGRRRQWA